MCCMCTRSIHVRFSNVSQHKIFMNCCVATFAALQLQDPNINAVLSHWQFKKKIIDTILHKFVVTQLLFILNTYLFTNTGECLRIRCDYI